MGTQSHRLPDLHLELSRSSGTFLFLWVWRDMPVGMYLTERRKRAFWQERHRVMDGADENAAAYAWAIHEIGKSGAGP